MPASLGMGLGMQRAQGGGAGGPPGPWTPGDLPAIWAYHDASVIASLFKDAAGTVPVTMPGDTVGRMTDLSGNARHLTQSNGGLRPDYADTAFGGVACLNGSAGINLARADGISGPQTWGVSFKLTLLPSVGNFYAAFSLRTAGGEVGIIYFFNLDGYEEISLVFSQSAPSMTTGFSPGLDTAVHRLIVTFSGTTYRAWLDGVEVTLLASGFSSPSALFGAVGALNDAEFGASMRWRRLAWSAAEASDADVALLDTWLGG